MAEGWLRVVDIIFILLAAHDYSEAPATLADHNFCEAIDQLALAFSSRCVNPAAVKFHVVL